MDQKILVLDFGSQYTHIIVRRCREANCYSELWRCDSPIEKIKEYNPRGIILSGGPSSVYEAGAPHLGPEFWTYVKEEKIPLLGICYGLQEMIHQNGGKVEASDHREFGRAELNVVKPAGADSEHPFLAHLSPNSVVWMSHGDKVTLMPEDFQAIGFTSSSPYAAVAHRVYPWVGVQFHPEVTHSVEGRRMLANFVRDVCGCEGHWTMESFLETAVAEIRAQVGHRPVIGALSGGVDSTVAAALMERAIGSQFHGFLVDTGLLRKHEGVEVVTRLRQVFPKVAIRCIDAREQFFTALKGVTEPERKRKIIGGLFVESFERALAEEKAKLDPTELKEGRAFLLQGTVYPDIIESSTKPDGVSHTIKTHHNVGGLPERMNLDVIEPLKLLFKDEVRALGEALGLPKDLVWRHPFPGPGLGIRIVGEVTPERADTLRDADYIFLEELRKAGKYDSVSQAFAVLLPDTLSVGVKGDRRVYEMTVALRSVNSSDFMTAEFSRLDFDLIARASERITNEVRGITRVVYDVTSKPPATVEWE